MCSNVKPAGKDSRNFFSLTGRQAGKKLFLKTGHLKNRKTTFLEQKKHNPLKIITKKPLAPTEYEIKNNPRSRSARLRIAEKK
jgi:16S rRNA (cytosine1402-N4)-methyltransferase